MTQAIIVIASLLGIAFVAWLVKYRRKRHEEETFWHKPTDTRAYQLMAQPGVRTPNGHTVHFQKGLTSYPEFLDAVDRGVEHTFEKGECAGFPVDRSRHEIRVCVLAGELAPESGDPSFRVAIWPPLFGEPSYYNGPFDMMKGSEEYVHYVLAAGQTIQAGIPDVIAVPYCPPNKLEYLATVCGYEMEHVLLAWHDGVRYEETKTHTSGGHPLLEECPVNNTIEGFAVRSIAAPRPIRCLTAKAIPES
jgi:hypothetical protein